MFLSYHYRRPLESVTAHSSLGRPISGRHLIQAGSIGYWIGQPYANKGYMSEAVRALIPFCFGSLRLHRLEAACIPTNKPSIALLERCGFQREGYARGYLCINGNWQDHLLFARLRTDPE